MVKQRDVASSRARSHVIGESLSRHGATVTTAGRLSNRLDGSCLDMLEEALSRGKPEVFNTDQGVQFTAQVWTSRLEAAGVSVSMDGRWRCLDNWSWSGCGGR